MNALAKFAVTVCTGQVIMTRYGFARTLLHLTHRIGNRAPQECDFIIVAVPQGMGQELAGRIDKALNTNQGDNE